MSVRAKWYACWSFRHHSLAAMRAVCKTLQTLRRNMKPHSKWGCGERTAFDASVIISVYLCASVLCVRSERVCVSISTYHTFKCFCLFVYFIEISPHSCAYPSSLSNGIRFNNSTQTVPFTWAVGRILPVTRPRHSLCIIHACPYQLICGP